MGKKKKKGLIGRLAAKIKSREKYKEPKKNTHRFSGGVFGKFKAKRVAARARIWGKSVKVKRVVVRKGRGDPHWVVDIQGKRLRKRKKKNR